MILGHVARGTRITVHGDYDVDGICSTAVLVRALRELGADVDWLPARSRRRRLRAGGDDACSGSRTRGTRLLVTVDCAITAVAEVGAGTRARDRGRRQRPPRARADGALPQAPIVHPRLCGYPCAGALCDGGRLQARPGAARAGARGEAGEPGGERARAMLSRGALEQTSTSSRSRRSPTSCRCVGENRALVASRPARAGEHRQARPARADGGRRVDPAQACDERAVAFALAPRLNAAGRLYRPTPASSCCSPRTRCAAAQIAEELDSANRERRQVEMRIRFQARGADGRAAESAPPTCSPATTGTRA